MVPVGVLKQAANEGTTENLNALSWGPNRTGASVLSKLFCPFLCLLSARKANVCVCACACACVCALAAPAILTREQRRVLFADGLLANGDAAESSKPPAANLGLSQSAATHSSKSSTSEYSEVRLACERPDHLQSPPNACVSVKLPLRKRRGSPDRVCFLTLMQSDGAL